MMKFLIQPQLPWRYSTQDESSFGPVYPARWSFSTSLDYHINCHSVAVLVFKCLLFYLTMVQTTKGIMLAIWILSDCAQFVNLQFLNVVIGMNREKHSIHRIQDYPKFQISTGGLGTHALPARWNSWIWLQQLNWDSSSDWDPLRIKHWFSYFVSELEENPNTPFFCFLFMALTHWKHLSCRIFCYLR